MAPIRNVFKAMEYVEKQALPEDEIDFEESVKKSYENPHILEYTRAVDKARELMRTGLTSGKMTRRGEKAAADLCGSEFVDPAVIVGAMKKLEDLEKI